MQSISFWLQTGSTALAFAAAGTLLWIAAGRHKSTAFQILAAAFFLNTGIGILTLVIFGWNSNMDGNGMTFYRYVQTPLHILSLVLMIMSCAMLAFDWKPFSFLGPASSGQASSKSNTAAKIAVILATLCSVPAAGWCFIMLLASGMKSSPHMSSEDSWIGGAPSVTVFLLLGGLMIFKQKLGLSLGYVITLALGALLCAAALLMMLMGYLNQS